MERHALSPSLYEVLGVSEDVSLEDVRRLRRELARRYHPDVAATPDPKRLVSVLAACDFLCDPTRRADYDARLAVSRARVWSRRRFPSSAMWLQALVYGLGATTLPGYVTAYWIGSDLSPARAQSSPHLLLLDAPVLITLAIQGALVVAAVVLVHTHRYRNQADRLRRVRPSSSSAL
jgi:hypothetical protein